MSRGGRRISLTAFDMYDGVFEDLYAVQFFQEEPGRAEFRYVPGLGFRETRLQEIGKRILAKLGNDFTMTMRSVKETEKTKRGKNRCLVSRLVDGASGQTTEGKQACS